MKIKMSIILCLVNNITGTVTYDCIFLLSHISHDLLLVDFAMIVGLLPGTEPHMYSVYILNDSVQLQGFWKHTLHADPLIYLQPIVNLGALSSGFAALSVSLYLSTAWLLRGVGCGQDGG